MNKRFLTLCVVMMAGGVMANQEILLWPNGAPGARGDGIADKPSLTVYQPETNATGAAMVICPGGGYGGLAAHEGHDYALFLNQHGVTCFVLRYRLGSAGYRHPVMLGDAARALRTVRANAAEWGVDAKRIGIMGSSAGGHLATSLLTHFDAGDPAATDAVDRVSSRPDLGVLCYAVITMGDKNTHRGSRANLLGDKPSAELIESLSGEKNVTDQTPPCFIWHTWEDGAVKVENSLEFAAALRAHGVPFDLHIYQKGQHGIGLADKPPFKHAHPWAADLLYWLKVYHFVK